MNELKNHLERDLHSIISKAVEPHTLDVSEQSKKLVIVLDDVLFLELQEKESGQYHFVEYLKGATVIPEPVVFQNIAHVLDYTLEAVKEYISASGKIRTLYEE